MINKLKCKKKNTERLKFQDFNICPNILYTDADPDSSILSSYITLTISVAALPLLRCFGVVEGVEVGVAAGVFLSVSLSSPLSSDDTLESDSSSISSQIAGNKNKK